MEHARKTNAAVKYWVEGLEPAYVFCGTKYSSYSILVSLILYILYREAGHGWLERRCNLPPWGLGLSGLFYRVGYTSPRYQSRLSEYCARQKEEEKPRYRHAKTLSFYTAIALLKRVPATFHSSDDVTKALSITALSILEKDRAVPPRPLLRWSRPRSELAYATAYIAKVLARGGHSILGIPSYVAKAFKQQAERMMRERINIIRLESRARRLMSIKDLVECNAVDIIRDLLQLSDTLAINYLEKPSRWREIAMDALLKSRFFGEDRTGHVLRVIEDIIHKHTYSIAKGIC